MKARVKETDEIVEVYESCNEDFPWTDEVGDKIWKTEELIFLETTEENFDYWIKLKHQYAGMAMQGILSNPKLFKATAKNAEEFGLIVPQTVAIDANCFAHALVQKIKEMEERK